MDSPDLRWSTNLVFSDACPPGESPIIRHWQVVKEPAAIAFIAARLAQRHRLVAQHDARRASTATSASHFSRCAAKLLAKSARGQGVQEQKHTKPSARPETTACSHPPQWLCRAFRFCGTPSVIPDANHHWPVNEGPPEGCPTSVERRRLADSQGCATVKETYSRTSGRSMIFFSPTRLPQDSSGMIGPASVQGTPVCRTSGSERK